MSVRKDKAPFPWFGGKSAAAPQIWEALGDVPHYVEPFAGSLVTLLLRPHPCNRSYFSETVNDFDGLLVNAWRSIQLSPDATADAASWPVSECDLHARHVAVVCWKEERDVERLMGDPDYHDPVVAGFWLYGQSAWIGSGWASGSGAWWVDDAGRFRKRKEIEPGVGRQRPHLTSNGQGVHHAGTREPGVATDCEWHPMTMPELRSWFGFLAARLRHVRILCGDWSRAVTSGASKTLPVRQGKGPAGIFLDPPYGDVRCGGLYAEDDLTVAAAVQKWCAEHGGEEDLRIVLAGFDTEHEELEALGWRAVEWFKAGFLTGGMGNTSKSGTHQQKRERLWLSPHCLDASTADQLSMFGGAA